MKKIKILLVDDHTVVRAGFRMLLASSDDIEIIAEAERGEVACQLYLELLPDVVVLDLTMPGIGGLDSLRRMLHRDPNAKVLVFSVHDESVYVNRALEAGAKGYITKNSAPETLAAAIREIASGKTYVETGLLYLSPNVTAPPSESGNYNALVNALSPREFDIFCLLAKGYTGHKIAEELCLGYKTVANYSTQIKNKMNVSTLAELAHLATGLGIIK